MIASPFQIRDQTIHKTTVKCAAHRSDQADFLAGCTVVDCDLLLVDSDATRFYQCVFENCRVVAQQEIAGGWTNCQWKNCTFVGDFSQACYGSRNADCILPNSPLVVGCDFKQANLCDIALCNADLDAILFPNWPNATFLKPFENKAVLMSLGLPTRFAKWWFYFCDNFEPGIDSASFNYDWVQAKLLNWNGSPDIEPEKDEVRAILSKLENVAM